jgi:hypothetical protein
MARFIFIAPVRTQPTTPAYIRAGINRALIGGGLAETALCTYSDIASDPHGYPAGHAFTVTVDMADDLTARHAVGAVIGAVVHAATGSEGAVKAWKVTGAGVVRT